MPTSKMSSVERKMPQYTSNISVYNILLIFIQRFFGDIKIRRIFTVRTFTQRSRLVRGRKTAHVRRLKLKML